MSQVVAGMAVTQVQMPQVVAGMAVTLRYRCHR